MDSLDHTEVPPQPKACRFYGMAGYGGFQCLTLPCCTLGCGMQVTDSGTTRAVIGDFDALDLLLGLDRANCE